MPHLHLHLVYTPLVWLLLPVAFALLYRRSRASRPEPGRWKERVGRIVPVEGGVEVWVHAASLGEVRAASPLIQALLARHGDGRVAVSTTTATGSEQVRAEWGARVHLRYLPFDLPPFVRWFLDRLQPRCVVIMESELWPNLFAALERRHIPLLIANARMSPRSARRYTRVRCLLGRTLSACSSIAAQTQADADRFIALGARSVVVCGNLKFECIVPPEQVQRGHALREQLGPKRKVWIAVSTHSQEEAWALEAHGQVLESHPDALLILVPRHPQRFEPVWDLLCDSALRCDRRSAATFDVHTQVLLGDSMGEMYTYLAAANAAFVGGSLVPIGGHNVLEPVALGLPVVFGTSMHNFAAPRELLIAADAAVEIDSPAALAPAIQGLFADPAAARQLGQRGLEASAQHQGTAQRLMDLLDSISSA